MLRTQYQGLRQTLCAPSVEVLGGGNLTIAKVGTYYGFLQGRNRAGVNLMTTAVPFAITAAGQRVQWTLPADCRRAGEDLHQIILSVSPDSNPTNAKVVAVFDTYELDQETPIALPALVTLERDAHLELGIAVATSSQLPSGIDRLHGMRRQVNDLGYIVGWDQARLAWVRVFPNAFSTHITDTAGAGGCDRDVALIEDSRQIITPLYAASGDVGTGVTFVIANNAVGVVPQGVRVGATVEVDGIEASAAFNGRFQLVLKGYVDLVTGYLDTVDLPSVDVPQIYLSRRSGIFLEKALPANYGFALEVRPVFSSYEFSYGVPQGAHIRVRPFFYETAGAYDESGLALGDYIAGEGDRRRIVPDTGLSGIALTGSGAVNSYTFNEEPPQAVVGLAANTPNQNIIITGNGTCFVETLYPNTVALRAKVSTLQGVGNPSEWKQPMTLDDGRLLIINTTYPTTIRANYPDVIAGNAKGRFNATKTRVYVQPVAGGDITQYEVPVIPGQTSQSIVIGSVTGTNIGTTLPTAANVRFGPYEYSTTSFTLSSVTASSTFSTTSTAYRVAIAPYYQNTITEISHSPTLGCIKELTAPLIDLLERIADWANVLESIGSFEGLLLDWSAPPMTGENQTALFADQSDEGRLKQRAANNGPVTAIGSSGGGTSSGSASVDNLLITADGRLMVDNEGNIMVKF
jgi:hypothetical protein